MARSNNASSRLDDPIAVGSDLLQLPQGLWPISFPLYHGTFIAKERQTVPSRLSPRPEADARPKTRCLACGLRSLRHAREHLRIAVPLEGPSRTHHLVEDVEAGRVT